MIYMIIIFACQLDYLNIYMIYLSINLNFKELIFIEMFFMIILDIYKSYRDYHIYK